MAELSQFEKDGVVYDLKDTTARAETAKKITAPQTAEVGQTIVVTEVDADGKPISWSVADLGVGNLRKIADVSVTEDAGSIEITTDLEGNPFSLTQMWVRLVAAPYLEEEETTGYLDFTFNGTTRVIRIGDSGATNKTYSMWELLLGVTVTKDNRLLFQIALTRARSADGHDIARLSTTSAKNLEGPIESIALGPLSWDFHAGTTLEIYGS